MKYPEILPSLKLCKKEETRRILNKAYGSRCQEANVPLLEDLVQKRHELATALGFSSYSEYILSIRMAKTPLNVQNFEQELTIRLLPKGKEEHEALQQLKRDETGDQSAILNPWDKSFYTNLQKEKFH